MQKIIKNWLLPNSLFLAILCTVVIFVLSMISPNRIPQPSLTHIDKVEHTLAYATLSFLWFCFAKKNHVKFTYISILILLYGIIIEVVQAEYTTNRSGDLYDFIANAIGCAIGYLFFKLVDYLYLEV